MYCLYSDCSDGDVRLVGSNYQHMGTVEVCRNNLWGLINEEEWGLADANVICHQLGYTKADSMFQLCAIINDYKYNYYCFVIVANGIY